MYTTAIINFILAINIMNKVAGMSNVFPWNEMQKRNLRLRQRFPYSFHRSGGETRIVIMGCHKKNDEGNMVSLSNIILCVQ